MQEKIFTENLHQLISLFLVQPSFILKCHHPRNSKYIALSFYDN
jgi:hypothetical protein